MKVKQEILTTVNPTVWNRLKRCELDCPSCPPHQDENKRTHKRYGVRRPKSKQRKRS